ncbi:YafY family protein [Chitinophaga sp. Cy-1792]|uniref:helix-turn-helix transcriptional regulator n=1 Tax=Chitinophaga sp. Cy-1792 TaxID=2608339 RepID=UPI001421B615|nr:WYL domain-containing protein [Chitinophaga sp. Cy-1792]NIG53892.1 WYL domain-containing protein [Chitinophaga sp. Cy-1792]
MPVNRNALIRYKTIDACLRNRRRRWTLEDIIDKVSTALYDYEGIEKGISRRTIQADIQMMRSDKLGYNAPIVIVEKKFYKYEDPDYSITNIPLSDHDLSKMTEAVEVLKQFKGFSHFKDLNEVVQKLEGHIYASSHNQRTIIDFEKNDRLKGLDHLHVIYEAIANEQVLELNYQSFKAREPKWMEFHASWLKEFKNRWFVVGNHGSKEVMVTLALDRIVEININKDKLYRPRNNGHTPETYYENTIGPTVMNQAPARVVIAVKGEHIPYVATKPLHKSQRILETTEDEMVIEMHVTLNLELEREILGFADGMKVLSPRLLSKRISDKLRRGTDLYNE